MILRNRETTQENRETKESNDLNIEKKAIEIHIKKKNERRQYKDGNNNDDEW